MKQLVAFALLIFVYSHVYTQTPLNPTATLILGEVSPNLMYTMDPSERIDTIGNIRAHIEYKAEGRFIYIECAYPVNLIEISIHHRNGEFKEFVMNEKLNKPIQEMRFMFPENDVPSIGNILRIKLNHLTHYYTFLEWSN